MACGAQVALFISFSTQTLERLWYTDSDDPAYFVDGHLTVAARLSVAFGLCGFMYACIMLIRAMLAHLPDETAEKHEREKAHAAKLVHNIRARHQSGGASSCASFSHLLDGVRGASFPGGLDRVAAGVTAPHAFLASHRMDRMEHRRDLRVEEESCGSREF